MTSYEYEKELSDLGWTLRLGERTCDWDLFLTSSLLFILYIGVSCIVFSGILFLVVIPERLCT